MSRRTRSQPMGPVMSIEPTEGNPPPAPVQVSHSDRRFLRAAQRRQARKRSRSLSKVMELGDVPAGSVLAPETVQAIQEGRYTMRWQFPAPTSPEYSKAPQRRRRRLQERQSRRLNRRKKR